MAVKLDFLKKSLNTKLIALFLLVSIMPIAIVGYISYANSEKALEKEQFAKLSALSETNEEAVLNFMDGEVAVIHSFSINKFIQDELSRETGRNSEGLSEELEEGLKSLNEGKDYSEIFIMDKSGKIIASSERKNVGLDKKDDEYFKGAMEAKDFNIKELYKSSTTGRKEFVISIPVKGHLGENIIGVIATRMGISQLEKGLKHSSEAIGKIGDAYIVNSDGLMMTPSRFSGEDAVLKTKVDSQTVRECLQGKESQGYVKDSARTGALLLK